MVGRDCRPSEAGSYTRKRRSGGLGAGPHENILSGSFSAPHLFLLRKGTVVRARANTATNAGFVPATVGPPSVKKRRSPLPRSYYKFGRSCSFAEPHDLQPTAWKILQNIAHIRWRRLGLSCRSPSSRPRPRRATAPAQRAVQSHKSPPAPSQGSSSCRTHLFVEPARGRPRQTAASTRGRD